MPNPNSFIFSILIGLLFNLHCEAQRHYSVIIDQNRDGKEQMARVEEEFSTAIEFQISHLYDELEDVCQLSDEQKTALQIAIKGAKLKYLREQMELATKYVQDQKAAKGISDEERELFKSGEKEPPAIGWHNPFQIYIRFDDPARIRKSKLWRSALKKKLTSAQLEKYTNLLDTRKLELREKTLDLLISRIDHSLFLSDDQEREIRVVIDKEFGEALVGNLILGDEIGATLPVGARVPRYEDFVQEILSDAQMIEWRSRVVPLLFRAETNVANGR